MTSAKQTTLSTQERARLYAAVKKHKRNSRLGAWLSSKNPKFALGEYHYGKQILGQPEENTVPKVGIILDGFVEVQGRIPRPPDKGIIYPYALRGPGELIGEMEYLYHKITNGPWRQTFPAYAGMQTLYFTPVVAKKGDPFWKVKERLHGRKQHYVVKIAWFSNLNEITEDGLDAFREIAFERLISVTSSWQPEFSDDIFKNHKPKSLYLFCELVKASQEARMVFRPFTLDEMKSVTPWDECVIAPSSPDKGYGRFEDNLVLGVHQPDDKSKPFIILPHFLFNSPFADPDKLNPDGLKLELPNDMKGDLGTTITIAKHCLSSHKSLVPKMTNSNRQVIAVWTEDKQSKVIKSTLDVDEKELIRLFCRTLCITKEKMQKICQAVRIDIKSDGTASDCLETANPAQVTLFKDKLLKSLGFVGVASLTVLPSD